MRLPVDPNPYASPHAENGPEKKQTVNTGFVRHRAFAHKSTFWGLTIGHSRERLRAQAEEFINAQVGAENVVSIVEHESPPDVVVWYREP
jgi:hypothetical protein